MGVVQRFKGKTVFQSPPILSAGNVTSGLTAHSGGTQAAALQLSGTSASVSTVAAAADSVKLPAAVVGASFVLENVAATNSMQVFGRGTDTINKVATATGVAQAAGVTAIYYCLVAGNWSRMLSA